MVHVIGACTLKEDQPLRLLLNLLFYHFNCSEPTYKSQRTGAFHATHYKQRFSHVSLETQCTVRYQFRQLPEADLLSVYVLCLNSILHAFL